MENLSPRDQGSKPRNTEIMRGKTFFGRLEIWKTTFILNEYNTKYNLKANSPST